MLKFSHVVRCRRTVCFHAMARVQEWPLSLSLVAHLKVHTIPLYIA